MREVKLKHVIRQKNWDNIGFFCVCEPSLAVISMLKRAKFKKKERKEARHKKKYMERSIV